MITVGGWVHATSAGGRRLMDVARFASLVSRATRPALAAIAAACVLAGSHQAAALNLARALTQYDHDCWQVVDGLHQNTGEVVKQTRDGHLWLGTFAFEVTTSLNDGPWKGKVSVFTFSVAPRFFET